MKWNLISMLIHSDVYFDGFCSRIEIQFRNFLLCCWMNYEFNKFFEQINKIMFLKDRWEFNTYLKIETAKQFLKITSLMFPWCLRINKVFFIKYYDENGRTQKHNISLRGFPGSSLCCVGDEIRYNLQNQIQKIG